MFTKINKSRIGSKPAIRIAFQFYMKPAPNQSPGRFVSSAEH